MRQCPKCGKRFLADTIKVCDNDGSALQVVVKASDRDLMVGVVVNNRYKIEDVLGDGGMGVVYRARDAKNPGAQFAVKVLRAEYSDEPDLVNRFQQEAETVAEVKHPNIVAVYEFGSLPDNSRYFVMELLEGRSLGVMLSGQGRRADAYDRYRPLPQPLTVHIAKQICDGLAAAHDRKIVHRDLKPDNIHLVKRPGDEHFIKILDFGIAKVQGSKAARTRTGSVFGTPHYMSPEQAQGERDIDLRTDVYALGVLMYQMACGRVPYDADNLMGILTAHLYQQPASPRSLVSTGELSQSLEAVILKALSKRRDARYASMRELKADLERIERNVAPLALQDPDVAAGRVATLEGAPASPPGASPSEPGLDRMTLPEGRVQARPSVTPGQATAGALPVSPSQVTTHMASVVPAALDASIPPVSRAAGGRGRNSLLVVGLSVVGLSTFAAAGAIVYQRKFAPAVVSAPPQPPQAPSVATAALQSARPGAQPPVVPPQPQPQPQPLAAQAPPVPTPPMQAPDAAAVAPPAQTADASAPQPEPVQPPAPALSPSVMLDSDPPGAEIHRGTELVGHTPTPVARPAAGTTVVYRIGPLEFPLHAEYPEDSVRLTLPVAPTPRPTRPGARVAPRPQQPTGRPQPAGGGIIDPFAPSRRGH